MTCDNGSCRYLTQMAHSFRVDEWGSKWSVTEADGGVDDAGADADADAVVAVIAVIAVAVTVVVEAEYRKKWGLRCSETCVFNFGYRPTFLCRIVPDCSRHTWCCRFHKNVLRLSGRIVLHSRTIIKTFSKKATAAGMTTFTYDPTRFLFLVNITRLYLLHSRMVLHGFSFSFNSKMIPVEDMSYVHRYSC
jgi:hypothetical protein